MGGEIYAKMEFTTHTISSLGAKFLYFCYSYNSCNNVIPLISRVLIGPYLNFCSLTSPNVL